MGSTINELISTHSPAMDLTIDDLAITYKETFTARSSWYNIGLALEMLVATLDDIESHSRDPKELLREVLKAWLRRARKPTWQSLVDALDNPIVDEPKLARMLQEKYCAAHQPEPTSSMQLLHEQVVADTEATAALKEAYLQQEHTLQDLQGTAAARSFQIQEFEEQVSEKKTKLEDTVTAQGLQIHKMVEKVREKKAQQQEEVTSDLSGATAAEGGLRLRWTVEESTPQMLIRGHDQAVVDGHTVYFFCPPTIRSYDSERKVWSTLPECPYSGCSLAIVNGLLTNIGGKIISRTIFTYLNEYKHTYTNILLSLIDREWCEQFHPMPTKRAKTAAVCTGKALVVAGGKGASGMKNTVEVMDTDTLQWSTVSSLPYPAPYGALATVCGDCLYLYNTVFSIRSGAARNGDRVLTCSLANLLQSCPPQSLVARIKRAFTKAIPVWQEVADVPVEYTTCAAFNGHLLAVGGETPGGQLTNNIYILNLTTNAWEVTSHMPTPRSECIVAVLPGNKLMVVGGNAPHGDTDKVRIAEVM